MLTDMALRSLKEFVLGTIIFARLVINGRVEDFSIHNKRIVGDAVLIDVLIDSGRFPGEVHLSEIRLFDVGGQLWLTRPVDLSKEGFSEGIFCRITLTFAERLEE